MKYNFQLQEFPNSNFEIDTSIWTGRSQLFKDNVRIQQSDEKGKPFLIPDMNGNLVMAFPKTSFPDPVPNLTIGGKKIQIVEKLKWFEYLIGGLPILLLLGGALGGAIGALGSIINFRIFRQEGITAIKYLKIFGIIFSCFLIYLLIAGYLNNFFN